MIKDHFVYSISIYKNFVYIYTFTFTNDHTTWTCIEVTKSYFDCTMHQTQNVQRIRKFIEKNTSRYNYVHISNQSAQLENLRIFNRLYSCAETHIFKSIKPNRKKKKAIIKIILDPTSSFRTSHRHSSTSKNPATKTRKFEIVANSRETERKWTTGGPRGAVKKPTLSPCLCASSSNPAAVRPSSRLNLEIFLEISTGMRNECGRGHRSGYRVDDRSTTFRGEFLAGL